MASNVNVPTLTVSSVPEWFNEPPHWKPWHAPQSQLPDASGNGNEKLVAQLDGFEMTAATQSDLWQRTHYGFRHDSGHIRGLRLTGSDFVLESAFSANYQNLYDQAGVALRVDSENWLKCGIEFVNGVRQISAVVTRDGYSDWSVVPLPKSSRVDGTVRIRVVRAGAEAVELFFALDADNFSSTQQPAAAAGEHKAPDWTMFRVAHLSGRELLVGHTSCAPITAGFSARFAPLAIRAPAAAPPAKQ